MHKGTGEIQPWLDFMAHLLPVEFERDWFLDWLAYKWVQSGNPRHRGGDGGADVEGQIFGTGRGMLRDILQRLLGKAYARPVDFDILTGKSSQGVFTDFLADAILIMVDEAKDTADAGRWSERRAVYERLKSVIDPRAIERSFMVKDGQTVLRAVLRRLPDLHQQSRRHPDSAGRPAVRLPRQWRADDRGDGEEAAGVDGSAGQHRRAGARGWRRAQDHRKFDPFEAPVTLTKTAMQELARSERDEAFLAVRRRIGKSGLFTGEQFHRAMTAEVRPETSRRGTTSRSGSSSGCGPGHDVEQRAVPDAERKGDGKRPLILRWRDYDGPAWRRWKTRRRRSRSPRRSSTPRPTRRRRRSCGACG